MFKQAVQAHDAIASTSPPQNTYKQASLGNTLGRVESGRKQPTRPLGNAVRQNSAGSQRPFKPVTQGIKRTSSGIAKSLSSQEDIFDYPTLNIAGMEKENELPAAFHNPPRGTSTGLATALFDEDDFDSDVDLDVEDPATKGTVTYPTLPQGAPANSRDSGYGSRPPTAQPKIQVSSQPIPWSSSPVEHFKTPTKPAVKTKRRQLPWGQNLKAQPVTETRDHIESDEDVGQPKKRRSTEPEPTVATPAPKDSKAQYPFNVTASGLKQQQKVFREQMKAQTKSGQAADDTVKEAIKKKKQNSVHRIFLSEEQQNVLNLVTEYKKSVFFTGSAGE
ncbi:hypothetical protein T440DRAFT_543679 [Plenodomus tracheiphilus IPT5]|uniref:Uncharacterized protein n=1 Tax=Plenodomus tracheiphilus IPT5 TaxID=1408161 RepID=A0A6A7ATW6_9PLEO|nr:hypothetical protein T440DRAFT_543679 [Plenodomus tracheiphilus IPT5]